MIPSLSNWLAIKEFTNYSNTSYSRRGHEKLPRSSSIDSMVDIVWNNESELSLPKHLIISETSNRRESLLSPRRTKQSRGINCKYWQIMNIWMCILTLIMLAFIMITLQNFHHIHVRSRRKKWTFSYMFSK